MRLAIELFAMAITITLGCLLLSSMITSGNKVADARDYYNVVVNRIEDSYCNEDNALTRRKTKVINYQ